MADKNLSFGAGLLKRFRDMGDNTHAEVVSIGKTEQLSALGYQQITSLSTQQFLSVPTGATMALIQAETQAVRWRDDDTVTASVGMVIAAGETLVYDHTLANIRFIEVTASAKLNIAYYG